VIGRRELTWGVETSGTDWSEFEKGRIQRYWKERHLFRFEEGFL
jgi:hypothetical protein